MRDIPYSLIMQDRRAYEIMLLRDQYGNTFANIAKEHEISVVRVVQIYNKLKVKQSRLYINHVAVLLGYEGTSQVRKVFNDAYECYQELPHACAYLEKKYKDILTEYRAGEPGVPTQFIKNMPSFKPRLSKKTIARVIEMREVEKASFVTIAKELRMTRAKAKRTYEMFYHKQALAIIEALQKKATNNKEKTAIWDYWFGHYKSSKDMYDALTKE